MRSPAMRIDSVSSFRSEMSAAFPPIASFPASLPSTPHPGSARKLSTGIMEILCSPAYSQIAFASRCSLLASNAAAVCRSSCSDTPSAGCTSVTFGFPSVTVPVLSSTTKSVLPACSSAVAFLNNIPCLAPIPLPTMIATGVASPREHGQLMTSTLMA